MKEYNHKESIKDYNDNRGKIRKIMDDAFEESRKLRSVRNVNE